MFLRLECGKLNCCEDWLFFFLEGRGGHSSTILYKYLGMVYSKYYLLFLHAWRMANDMDCSETELGLSNEEGNNWVVGMLYNLCGMYKKRSANEQRSYVFLVLLFIKHFIVLYPDERSEEEYKVTYLNNLLAINFCSFSISISSRKY